ncbi:MAG TPA: hypothetical protein VI078_11285 [bacterium]
MTEGRDGSPRRVLTPRRLVGLCMLIVTAGVYAGSLGNGFTNFDDLDMITQNPHVRSGLTSENVLWAFGSFEKANWHPVTWISHQADVQLFGLDARRHHLTSLLLHLVATLALFLALAEMTGTLWRSGLAALLFGVHPLHVESVAWIADRKDVLAGMFFMLALLAYVRYVRRPGAARYLALLVLSALGLMAKQMLVTLPLLLLLLDFWPLRRLDGGRTAAGQDRPRVLRVKPLAHCLVEKGPLLAMSLAAGAMTLRAQWRFSSLELSGYPFGQRAANAVVSAAEYLVKFAWPARLSAFYPMGERELTAPLVGGALCIVAGIGILAGRRVRSQPWLATGWLWYLVGLTPVIGLIQVGDQRMADRYTYLPLIGVFVMATWGIGKLAARAALVRPAAGAAVVGLAALLPITRIQAGYWRDDFTLFQHAAATTSRNWQAYSHVGFALAAAGRTSEAQPYLDAAAQLSPWYRFGLLMRSAQALERIGNLSAALDQYRKASAVRPSDRLAREKMRELEGAVRAVEHSPQPPP